MFRYLTMTIIRLTVILCLRGPYMKVTWHPFKRVAVVKDLIFPIAKLAVGSRPYTVAIE